MYLKNLKGETKEGQAQWFMPISSTLWEDRAGRRLWKEDHSRSGA